MPLLLVLLGCEPDTVCRTEENVYLKCVFSCDSMVTTADSTYYVSFTSIDSVSAVGVGRDSLLYDNQKAVSSLLLPLRRDTTVSRFALTLNGQTDTLAVIHENRDYFVSLACGCFVYHTLDTVLSATGVITGSQILNSSVENVEQENVKLLIRL